MSYPKPLSKKNIDRLYAETGLIEEQITFLHTFFSACANLYGIIEACEAWEVYKELSAKTKTVPLHKREMYAALGILRREEVPFYVFEVDEVYSEDERKDANRLIVHRDLVGYGYGKFNDLYDVYEKAVQKPFYVPENLPDYTVMPESRYEKELLTMLNGLRSTHPDYKDRQGKIRPCPYKGKYLREFSFIGTIDAFDLNILRGEVEGWKGNPKRAAELEAKLNSVTAAQYLVNEQKRFSTIGRISPTEAIKVLFDDLEEMGVGLLDMKRAKAIVSAAFNMHNNQHLWCLRGWTPTELSNRVKSRGIPTVTFGPGMQKAFAEGTMNREEIMRMIREMGLKTE